MLFRSENIAWAIGYNLLALPLAASGALTPWMAAVGMALSSLLVTLNALRLARVPAMPNAQRIADGRRNDAALADGALDQAALGEAAP